MITTTRTVGQVAAQFGLALRWNVVERYFSHTVILLVCQLADRLSYCILTLLDRGSINLKTLIKIKFLCMAYKSLRECYAIAFGMII